MATTNHERVGKALQLLQTGLGPFVERELKSALKKELRARLVSLMGEDRLYGDKPIDEWDVAGLLKVMWEAWNEVFRRTLGPAERSLVGELRDYRNRWAHQDKFSSDDADRALDSIARLLAAVSAPQAEQVQKMKMELRRVMFEEQARTEKRKTAGTVISSQAATTLKPWREVVNPHQDVANGRYMQAEFAADLWQVYIGEGTDEYRDPVEFFKRTYLTESLSTLLVNAGRRLSGQRGDPVVQLQTNFGGGKTHSMLALYHLFSGGAPDGLGHVADLLSDAGLEHLPQARRVVLVGNRISTGNPVSKPDGTVIHTLWGELAWQLGGRKAYEVVRADDERATSPGDKLRQLMNEYGPCLILIDEWVAYARQLHDASDLPAGSFETHFTFAQALTESARAAKQCLVVISLPASDTTGSPHAQADDAEVGGERGRVALDRLRNVVGRMESSWRPASAEEGFEIVRRRLFEPLVDQSQFVTRDSVARAFYDLYRTQQQEFPNECSQADYEKRLRAAYPVHPEIFDRLYTEWSTLAKFQRTRGVLRLMAAVIHSLWEKGDRNPLILPASIPIDDPRVQSELTRYLSDNWTPIIEKDVDGPGALPLRIDGEVPNLGKYHACRRAARTIYMGSAPTSTAAHRGIDDRRVKLGCVMPGESPSLFGDALRRMSGAATFLYQDGTRYWYSTQATVTKVAEDRAEELRRDPGAVAREIERRVRDDVKDTGGFRRVHPFPQSGADVSDELDARLVVLSIEHPYSREPGNKAEVAARAIFEFRGPSPRLYRNALVFLAIDKARLQDLDEAVRYSLAWRSILDDQQSLDLSPHQVRQAESQLRDADGSVMARLPEAYQWLLVPVQEKPTDQLKWEAYRLNGSDSLAGRASRKLRTDELLVTSLAPSVLRDRYLDAVPLWRGNHVEIAQLAEDFARYTYLQRLRDSDVLYEAVRSGLALLTWSQDSFAYADSHDETNERYRGLRGGELVNVSADNCSGLLVKPDVAAKQLEAERASAGAEGEKTGDHEEREGEAGREGDTGGGVTTPPTRRAPTRFHGSVQLDSTRVSRDAGKIAEEVIAHLVAISGSSVRVTLEIEADISGGAPENIVRIVTENSRALKFTSQGFEEE
jgi:predicted AAA+ superfamily ATPase